jgi:hypothetical protein
MLYFWLLLMRWNVFLEVQATLSSCLSSVLRRSGAFLLFFVRCGIGLVDWLAVNYSGRQKAPPNVFRCTD